MSVNVNTDKSMINHTASGDTTNGTCKISATASSNYAQMEVGTHLANTMPSENAESPAATRKLTIPIPTSLIETTITALCDKYGVCDTERQIMIEIEVDRRASFGDWSDAECVAKYEKDIADVEKYCMFGLQPVREPVETPVAVVETWVDVLEKKDGEWVRYKINTATGAKTEYYVDTRPGALWLD